MNCRSTEHREFTVNGERDRQASVDVSYLIAEDLGESWPEARLFFAPRGIAGPGACE
ncbi:MAG: hypothetical protein ACK5UC_24595 [Planctomycetaceae bacterium]